MRTQWERQNSVNLGGLRKEEALLMMIDPSPVLVGT